MSHLTGNQFQIFDLKYLFIISVYLQAYGDNTCILIYLYWSLEAMGSYNAVFGISFGPLLSVAVVDW